MGDDDSMDDFGDEAYGAITKYKPVEAEKDTPIMDRVKPRGSAPKIMKFEEKNEKLRKDPFSKSRV